MGSVIQNIEELCKVHGITGYKLCKDIGSSPSLITDLRKGRKTTITAETAIKIADYFSVTVQYLLGEEQKEKATAADNEDDCLTARKKIIAEKIMKLTDEEFERYESIIDKILS